MPDRPLTAPSVARYPTLGAWLKPDGAHFRVWAPDASTVGLVLEGDRALPMDKSENGTFQRLVPGLKAGARYRYRVDGAGPFPDPASRFQPDGVDGPSELIDPSSFVWNDAGWRGVTPEVAVFYELHVGTFTPEGTFTAAIGKLPLLCELGVTVVELMPVGDFAGRWNWGYDGVALFAPSRAYGRPDDLRSLIDAAHSLGLGVVLDVVYNHFGPAGDYTACFSKHYLSDKSASAWAARVDLGNPMVREFFIENALHWADEYHFDGFRLDATNAYMEEYGAGFVAELTEDVRKSVGPRRLLFAAEDFRNLKEMPRPTTEGGWGLDGVWADDFHHEMRVHLCGDDDGYFACFSGRMADLAATINQGWFYTGQFYPQLKILRGTDPSGIAPRSFYFCIQNHDQIGNRARGDRLNHAVEPPVYRAASALLLALPHTPLLFMGQEWAASSPFQFFTDHEPALGKTITEGRRKEFGDFREFASADARERIPDPQAPETFARSHLNWPERIEEPHASTWRLYQALLKIRRTEPALRANRPFSHEAVAIDESTLLVKVAPEEESSLWIVFRPGGPGRVVLHPYRDAEESLGDWSLLLTTEDPSFAPDPAPPELEWTDDGPRLVFARSGTVILRRMRASHRPRDSARKATARPLAP